MASADTASGRDWRAQRTRGMLAIAVASIVATALWLAIRYVTDPISGMDTLGARMIFTLKCCCVATLFCFVTGVDAVAHERLQSRAFEPPKGVETQRLRVNLRYLQNTLEQLVIFAIGLFGLAAYADGSDAMRAVLATTIVWIVARFAFWIGYHRGAAMRGLGAPGMALGLLVLLYVIARIGDDIAGTPGAAIAAAAYLAIEIFLFRARRVAGAR